MDSVLVPCGFEESLVAFDSCCSVLNGNGSDYWPQTEIDYADTLSDLDRQNIDRNSSTASEMNVVPELTARCRVSRSVLRSRRPFLLWSPRLRVRDERKRVLKISIAKLRHIDDPESCLRRSVLLSNTLRGLQRHARDEKLSGRTLNDTKNHPILKSNEPITCPEKSSVDSAEVSCSRIKRRRISDVANEDETLNQEPVRTEPQKTNPNEPQTLKPSSSLGSSSSGPTSSSRSCASGSPLTSGSPNFTFSSAELSCGKSSLFGELQSVVFHSLITSLES